MKKCSMQKKIESLGAKNEDAAVTKEDVIKAFESIRDGYAIIMKAYGEEGVGPFGPMLEDILWDDNINGLYACIFADSFNTIPLSEWCDAIVNGLKDYKEQTERCSMQKKKESLCRRGLPKGASAR